MLRTPREHLPIGFPLPSHEESRRFEPIWERAFEIHANAHDFISPGPWQYRNNILAAVEGDPNYCDCYEHAYQEFWARAMGEPITIPATIIPRFIWDVKRCIRLEA